MNQILSFEELDELLTKLHDCSFDLDRMRFDEEAGIWTGIFLRPLWGDPRAEQSGLAILYVKTRLPLAEVTLKFARVENVKVIEDQGIGLYTFNEIERATNALRLVFNQTMEIHLQLSKPIEASYQEQPLPGRWAIYRQFLFIQSGPEIENLSGS